MRVRVAAIQLVAELGAVAENLRRAERLLDDAIARGAQWVMLPEFFPSAIAFDHRKMAGVVDDGRALALLTSRARQHRVHVGGSFIRAHQGDRFNTFALARPDGSVALHDKDIPTFWEGCYYRGGTDDGVTTSGALRVGMAVCWEFIRTQTVRRLAGKVDVVVGGSCWPGPATSKLMRALLPGFEEENVALAQHAVPTLARLVGAPVLHAGHAGVYDMRLPLLPLRRRGHFVGESKIVDAAGNVLAQRSAAEGAGVVLADVEIGAVAPVAAPPERFWITPLSARFRRMWRLYNGYAARAYAHRRRAGFA